MAALKGAVREQGRARGSSTGAKGGAYRDIFMLVPFLGGAQQVGA